MDKKQLPVITISRLYGAGGRSVAKGISEKLGLQYYDVDFIRLTAKVSGYSESEIRKEGEDLRESTKFVNRFLPTASFSNSYDDIFLAQKAVILGLAKDPCIIVGRCSNIILQEAGIPSFNVFLSANWEDRIKKAEELGENEGMDIDRYVERRDHWRKTYYKAYTEHEYGYAPDYDLCLNVSRYGIDRCVDLIVKLASEL